MIEIDQAEFQYRQSEFRLSVPRLKVKAGSAVAMIGPSGSGKTTLLNLVAGILVPDIGRVTTFGVEVSARSAAARRRFRLASIGLVFQEFELLEHLSVLDNILLSSRISSLFLTPAVRTERARRLAEEVGIADKLNRFPRKLSQGERQRVALCRALLLEPPLLLCDEPTGNLDPTNKQHVLDILFEQTRRTGTTLLAVTHDHDVLDRFDRTIDVKQFHDAGREAA